MFLIFLFSFISSTKAKEIYVDQFVSSYSNTQNDEVQKAFLAAKSGDKIIFGSKKFYYIRNLYLNNIHNLIIEGNGATLNVVTNKGASYYQDAGAIGLYSCQNIVIQNIIIDGKRDQQDSSGFNMGIFIGKTQHSPTFFKDNGGDNKPSKNITIQNCIIKNTGKPNVGIDTFGDGVGAHFVDGLLVKACRFENVGRWAVAVSESFNVRIEDNMVNNPENGTALGSFDIENEGEDNINGSFSKNIVIENNEINGRGPIYLVTGRSPNNKNGKLFGIDNVIIKNNTLNIQRTENFAEDAIYIIATSDIEGSPISISNIQITQTSISASNALRMRYGINMVTKGKNSVLENVDIKCNSFAGVEKAINFDILSSQKPRNIRIENNTFSQKDRNNSFYKKSLYSGLISK